MNTDLCRRIILPCCPSYESARQLFNRSIQKWPSSIIYCRNKEEAAQAVCYGASQKQIIRVRSGGHNYEGTCLGNGKMTIDTSLLKEIQIDSTCTLKIGAGVSNRELYFFLKQYGYPFPSGTCPTVNAVGLTQGGGWGHSLRMYGLACDSLVAAELIDPSGRMITASETSHPDLFWALRGGGGGNFGVVTSLSYRLTPVVSHVTYVNIEYSRIDEFTALRFFQTWQAWTTSEEIRFTPNSRIFNSARDGMGIFLRGFFYGTPDEAKKAVQPFLDVSGAKVSFRYVTFWEATELDASIYPASETFRFAGRFAYADFSDSQILSLLGLIKTRARGSTYASVALYAMGGSVREIKPCETAFYYRNSDFIIGIETVWEDCFFELENDAWMEARFPYLRSLTTGSYINFPYLCTDHYMEAYYGGNKERLSDIKKRYDPENLFRFPQSIRAERQPSLPPLKAQT